MKNRKLLVVCVVLFVLALIPQISSASGSLRSYGSGLWDYYGEKSMACVKNHAPEFERITSEKYILDEAVIQGVELYLMAEFKNDKLVVLQILTPYPDYTWCSDEIKDISYNFGSVGSMMMGIEFNIWNDCKIEDGMAMCMKGNNFCLFEICPKEMGAYACTSTDLMN